MAVLLAYLASHQSCLLALPQSKELSPSWDDLSAEQSCGEVVCKVPGLCLVVLMSQSMREKQILGPV